MYNDLATKKKYVIDAILRPTCCRSSLHMQARRLSIMFIVLMAAATIFFGLFTTTPKLHIPVPLPPFQSPVLHLSASTVEYLQRPSDSTIPLCCIGSQGNRVCYPKGGKGGKSYRILFHSNYFGLRGTEVAMFD